MRSLRTTLLAGFGALSLALVVGFAATVYAEAARAARVETAVRLRFHARTLAGLLEVGKDGVEFEAGEGALPGFDRPGSGAYVEIVDAGGKAVVRSPSLSLSGHSLPPAPSWEPGLERIEEEPEGPDGGPCASIVRAFEARGDEGLPGGRFRIRVTLSVAERDRRLADLARFLLLTGAAALALTAGGGWLLARRVLAPLERMTREAAALGPGDPDRRLHPGAVVAELNSLAVTLNGALDRLATALETEKRFTADASHELRTPVSVLLADAELLLRRERTPEEYRAGLQRMVRTVRRMKGITEDLLALARADAGATAMARNPVDLAEVLDTACEEVLPLAEAKGIRLDRPGAGRVGVTGDFRYLEQMAVNLLENAVKFTPRGGAVSAVAAPEGDRAILSVSDSGPGIPAEHLDRLSERFYRVREGSGEAEGTGLGLAIVHWIVGAHGGTLAVESPPGRGATFRVRLPMAP